MAEMTKDTPKYIWPITVTTDRYGGCYSKGKFLAFNLLPWQVPEEIDGDDITCMDFGQVKVVRHIPLVKASRLLKP
jgi:hypothetical protein